MASRACAVGTSTAKAASVPTKILPILFIPELLSRAALCGAADCGREISPNIG
jgi:hypothetical protein